MTDPETAPGHFRAEGAPDPLACESESQRAWRPLPDESGCCDRLPPGTGTPTGSAYTTWLNGYRRERCAEVECPESTAWSRPERCETQVFCWRGRCRDACDGIPDESSLPIAEVSSREAVRRAREQVRGEPEPPSGERPRCAARPLEGLIVVGSFAHDRGCRFTGAFVGETLHQDRRAAARAFLETDDWAGAEPRERERMARTLARAVPFAMQNAATSRPRPGPTEACRSISRPCRPPACAASASLRPRRRTRW